jgi:hypothetical protein
MKKFHPSLLLAGTVAFCTALSPVTGGAQGALHLAPSSMGELTTAPYNNRQTFTFPTPAVSLANYGGISVTFNAPIGYAWRFDPNRGDLVCYVNYGTWPSGGFGYGGGAPYSFNFVPGMGSAVHNSLYDPSYDSETSFGFRDTFYFGGVVEFKELNVSVSHAVLLDEYQRQLPLNSFEQAYLDGGSGQVRGGLTLVPVPEPGVAVLTSGCLAILMIASGQRSEA